MKKITLGIDGMACSMCESHINDAVRREFNVKKVTSSHSKGETIIISDDDIPKEKLEKVIGDTGYKVLSVNSEEYTKEKKKGFLSGLFGK